MTINPVTKGLPPVHPGAILREETLPRLRHADTGKKVTKIEFAAALDITRQMLDLILNGKQGISVAHAIRLAKILGTTPDLWINLQIQYELRVAADKIDLSTLPTFATAA